MSFNAVVEGDVDAAVVYRLCETLGVAVPRVIRKGGRGAIARDIGRYLQAARVVPGTRWLVLADLDREECVPAVLERWAPDGLPPGFCLRVAVREVEAWLLADAGHVARALGVPKTRIPDDVEGLSSPKRTIVDLARRSRRSPIARALVPRSGSGRSVGSGYSAWAIDFIREEWDPMVAAERSPSLRRAIECIRGIVVDDGAGE